MKARYIVIALVVVGVIIAGGLGILSANIDSFRPKIQAELQQKLNRPVTIGHLGLRIFPLSIKVEGFSIGDDPAFGSAPPFATASEVFVSAGLFSLIGGSPQVKDVELNQPQIELIRNAQGKWNFTTLGHTNSSNSNSKFTLDKLQINDGKVALTDIEHQQPRSVYDHIDLKMTDFAPDTKFGVDLGVHLPGEGKQLADFKGKVGPLSQGSNSSLPPVAGHISLEQVSLAAVNRFAAGTLPPQTDSVASGGADVDTGGGKISAKGDLKLDDTVIRGAKLGYPIQAKYAVTADQAFDRIDIQTGNVSLGPTSFSASGSINNTVKPAVLDVRVKTSDSSITEMAKLAGAMGVAFNPKYKIDGRLSVDLAAKGPTNAPQLSGSISAKNVSASGGEIKEPVSTPQINLTLTPQAVVSNTFTAKSGSTALDIAFSLANYTTKDPVADVTLRSNGAQIAELLNIAKAYGVSAAEGMNGTGTLSIDVHAHGDTAHPDSLAYAGTSSIQNASISTPELTKPVGIHSANAQFSQNSVALSNLAATVGSSTLTGSLSAHNFAAPAVQFALSADKIDTGEMEDLVANRPAKPATPAHARTSDRPSILQSMTGGGTLSVGTIKAQEIVLSSVSTKVTLDHGLVTLSPMSAGAFGGKINGTVAADMRPKVPDCSLNAKLTGMDANALMSAVSTMKNELYGSLTANTNLKFAIASSNDLAHTLNGTVEFALANGELKNVNILSDISKAAKFLNNSTTASTGNSTALKQFSGTLNIVNGVASTNNLKAAMNEGSLAANGSLNLVNQGLNMHMLAALATAGQGSGGGLTLPVMVTGTTSHMVFTPDVQALAKMKLGGLVSGAASGKGLGGLLNGVLGGQQAPPDAKQKQQQQNNNQNPLGSLLDQLKKKQ